MPTPKRRNVVLVVSKNLGRSDARRAQPKAEHTGPSGKGQQGLTTCPVCHAEVTRTKASLSLYSVADLRAQGVEAGDPVVSRHRHGGGGVSIRKGQAPCLGTGRAA